MDRERQKEIWNELFKKLNLPEMLKKLEEDELYEGVFAPMDVNKDHGSDQDIPNDPDKRRWFEFYHNNGLDPIDHYKDFPLNNSESRDTADNSDPGD